MGISEQEERKEQKNIWNNNDRISPKLILGT